MALIPIAFRDGNAAAQNASASNDFSGYLVPSHQIVPGIGLLLQAAGVAGANGNNSYIGASSGQRIYIYWMIITAAASVNFTFISSPSTGLIELLLSAGQAIQMPFTGEPYFATAVGAALEINLSAGVSVAVNCGFLQA